ncbi:MAG: OB-fold protein [Flavobacteriales bacterium]
MRPKIMIAVLGTVAVIGGGTYAYMEYSRGNAGADAMRTVTSIPATDLLAAYSTDEAAADKRFVGEKEQAIEVSGTIRAIEPVGDSKTNVILETGDPMAGVVCEFANSELPIDWRSGATVKVKGICKGMQKGDGLLEMLGSDVLLTRCAASQ